MAIPRGIILWAMLGATLVLAMLVKEVRQRTLAVRLGPSHRIGAIEAALPADWTPRHIEGGILVEEPGTAALRRQLSILRHAAPSMRDPLEHLGRVGVIGESWRVQPLRMAGWPGVIVDDSMHAWESGRPPTRMVVAAAAVLPSGEALVVWLDGPGAVSAADVRLVRQVCASLRVEGAPLPQPAEQLLELDGQTLVQIPEGFVTAGADPFGTGRQILRMDGRLAAELVPCVTLDEDASGEFAAMLRYRDGTVQWGKVQRVGGQTYRCQRVGQEAGRFPAVAYLLVGAEHVALLVEIRMRPGEESGAQELWETVARPARMAGNESIQLMLANGVELAGRINKAWWVGGGMEGRQTWLWRDRFTALALRSEVEYESDDAAAWGTRRDVGRDGTVVSERRWRSDQAGYEYESAGRRIVAQAGRAETRWAPGGWLMAALGSEFAGPAIVRSESFVDEAGPVEGLLTLRVEESADMPRYMDGEADPMRCLAVTVSGSGRVSRWYYDQAGELRYVDFAHGVHVWRER